MNRIAPIFLCFLIGLLSISCASKHDSTELILGLNIGATPKTVENQFKATGGAWIVVEDSTLPPGDTRPPFDVMEVRVDGALLSAHDAVFLSFFNKQLMRVSFYAASMEELQGILDTDKFELEMGEKKIYSKARLTIQEDPNGLIRVECESIDLAMKKWNWIKQHS